MVPTRRWITDLTAIEFRRVVEPLIISEGAQLLEDLEIGSIATDGPASSESSADTGVGERRASWVIVTVTTRGKGVNDHGWSGDPETAC